jgi:hypothetical protein
MKSAITPSALFKFYGGRPRPLPGDEALVCRGLTGELIVVPRDVAAAVAHCTVFRTLADHAQLLTSVLPGGPACGTWEGGLEQARQMGVLTGADQVRDIMAAGLSQVSARPVIRTIGVPTKDRPAMLHRLLLDMAGHLQIHDRRATILVADDSESAAMRRANADAILSMAGAAHLNIVHVDWQVRSEFAARLSAATGVAESVVRFALTGEEGADAKAPVTVGACRNTLLLASAGMPLLFVDDDVRCRTTPIPGARDEVILRRDAFTGRFFETAEEIAACDFREDDLVRVHERALATSGDELAKAFATCTADDLNAIPPTWLKACARTPGSVLVSCMGVVGDAAVDDSLHYYLHGADTLAQLARSERLYRAALENRLLMRGPRGRIVSGWFDGMSYCMGVDNRAVLPPFMPVMRAEESVFSSLVGRMAGAMFAVSPFAILHQPGSPRRFPENAAEGRAGRFTLNDMVSVMIRAEPCRGTSTDDRLRSLGFRLHEIAVLPDLEFDEHAGAVLAPIVLGYIQALDAAVSTGGDTAGAALWKDDVQRLRAACVGRLRSGEFLVPIDLADRWGVAEARPRARRALARFASLLQVWSDLADGAARLRVEGSGLVREPRGLGCVRGKD